VTISEQHIEHARERLTQLGFTPVGWVEAGPAVCFVGGFGLGRRRHVALGYGDPRDRAALHVRVTTSTTDHGLTDEPLLAAAYQRLATRCAPRGQAGSVRRVLRETEPVEGTVRLGDGVLMATIVANEVGSIARAYHDGLELLVEACGVPVGALQLGLVDDLAPYLDGLRRLSTKER
jgi:hypothetical protein